MAHCRLFGFLTNLAGAMRIGAWTVVAFSFVIFAMRFLGALCYKLESLVKRLWTNYFTWWSPFACFWERHKLPRAKRLHMTEKAMPQRLEIDETLPNDRSVETPVKAKDDEFKMFDLDNEEDDEEEEDDETLRQRGLWDDGLQKVSSTARAGDEKIPDRYQRHVADMAVSTDDLPAGDFLIDPASDIPPGYTDAHGTFPEADESSDDEYSIGELLREGEELVNRVSQRIRGQGSDSEDEGNDNESEITV